MCAPCLDVQLVMKLFSYVGIAPKLFFPVMIKREIDKRDKR